MVLVDTLVRFALLGSSWVLYGLLFVVVVPVALAVPAGMDPGAVE